MMVHVLLEKFAKNQKIHDHICKFTLYVFVLKNFFGIVYCKNTKEIYYFSECNNSIDTHTFELFLWPDPSPGD